MSGARPLRVVLAPNSFKDGANALQAAAAFEEGVRFFSQISGRSISTRTVPICDGGTGFAEILGRAVKPLGREIIVDIRDPLGRRRKASYVMVGRSLALIESARAIGLALLSPCERNPIRTTSYGVGQIIVDAIRKGARRILVGCGDSATCDCGMGLLAATGVRFFDRAGKEIKNPRPSDLAKVSSFNCEGSVLVGYKGSIEVVCNLSSIAAGPNSTAITYARQKGASKAEEKLLLNGIENFTRLVGDAIQNPDAGLLPGSGAAGGIGFALGAFTPNIHFTYSFETIFREVNLERHLDWADVVITGEGLFDRNSAKGKAPVAVALLARRFDVRPIGIVGSIEAGVTSQVLRSGFELLEPLTDSNLSIEHFIKNFRVLAREATTRALLKLEGKKASLFTKEAHPARQIKVKS